MIRFVFTNERDVRKEFKDLGPMEVDEDCLDIKSFASVVTADVWVHLDSRQPYIHFIKKEAKDPVLAEEADTVFFAMLDRSV